MRSASSWSLFQPWLMTMTSSIPAHAPERSAASWPRPTSLPLRSNSSRR